MGYNGSPPGTYTCDEAGHIMHEDHCVRTIHSEENAILNSRTSLLGAIAYCTHRPCPRCATLLCASGIGEIRYLESYPEVESSYLHFTQICRNSGVVWQKLEG